jgi:hypothetical protein
VREDFLLELALETDLAVPVKQADHHLGFGREKNKRKKKAHIINNTFSCKMRRTPLEQHSVIAQGKAFASYVAYV